MNNKTKPHSTMVINANGWTGSIPIGYYFLDLLDDKADSKDYDEKYLNSLAKGSEYCKHLNYIVYNELANRLNRSPLYTDAIYFTLAQEEVTHDDIMDKDEAYLVYESNCLYIYPIILHEKKEKAIESVKLSVSSVRSTVSLIQKLGDSTVDIYRLKKIVNENLDKWMELIAK